MDNNGSALDLPLEGAGWTITLPMEEWCNLVVEVTKFVEVLGGAGITDAEHLDKTLQQAVSVAQGMPPLVIPE